MMVFTQSCIVPCIYSSAINGSNVSTVVENTVYDWLRVVDICDHLQLHKLPSINYRE
jgi:hypothetical protein